MSRKIWLLLLILHSISSQPLADNPTAPVADQFASQNVTRHDNNTAASASPYMIPIDDATRAILEDIVESGENPTFTFVDNSTSFIDMAIVLAYTFRIYVETPLIALTADLTEVQKQRLRNAGMIVIAVPTIRPPTVTSARVQTFSKFHVWQFTMFEKATYIDADILVINDYRVLTAHMRHPPTCEIIATQTSQNAFNSGFFHFHPSSTLFDLLIDTMSYPEKWLFDALDNQVTEQNVLVYVFSHLRHSWCADMPCLHLTSTHIGRERRGCTALLHFAGYPKPGDITDWGVVEQSGAVGSPDTWKWPDSPRADLCPMDRLHEIGWAYEAWYEARQAIVE